MWAQTGWIRYHRNPVMVKSNNGYENLAIGSPSVIFSGDTLRMFYAATDTAGKGRLFYAVSVDGVHWTKYRDGQPVLDTGNPGEWDDHFLDTPEIIADGTEYKLYYFGDRDNHPAGSAIGLAVSTDLVHWHKTDVNPVLQPGAPGEWDGLFIESPSVVKTNGQYYMLYTGVDTTWRAAIGLAVSSDGITWTKYPGNPVISPGRSPSWDDFSVATPSIIKTEKGFEAWYCGISVRDMRDNNRPDTVKIGYAISEDAVHWHPFDGNPVLSTYSPPYNPKEIRGPWAPDIVYRKTLSQYQMWYETAYGFGYAVSREHKACQYVVFPNPTNDFAYISSPSPVAYYELYDTGGRLIDRQNHRSFVSVLQLPEGVYLLKIRTGDGCIDTHLLIRK